jgi:acyl-CoA dehydrogenase
VLRFENCRVPKENLLGSPEIDTKTGFAGVMQTFDNTRPPVDAMAVGVARAALEETARILTVAGVAVDYDRPVNTQHAAAAAYLQLEADFEAAYLLTLESA